MYVVGGVCVVCPCVYCFHFFISSHFVFAIAILVNFRASDLMLKFVRNLLAPSAVVKPIRRLLAMDNSSDHDMLDLLAFNCSKLTAQLTSKSISPEEQNRLIAEYIERANDEHKSIKDFKQGKNRIHRHKCIS